MNFGGECRGDGGLVGVNPGHVESGRFKLRKRYGMQSLGYPRDYNETTDSVTKPGPSNVKRVSRS